MTSKNRFFAENGTGGANPRSNPKALELWFARLKSETDKQPLEWIKQMLKNVRNERIAATGLMNQIHSCKDGHVYYNPCCNGEEESEDEASYQGSVFKEDASAIKDSENDGPPPLENAIFNEISRTEEVGQWQNRKGNDITNTIWSGQR